MVCFSCLDAMREGDVKLLKELRDQCPSFNNNQCKYLGDEGMFQQKVQDSAIKLATSRVQKMLNTMGIVILFIVGSAIVGISAYQFNNSQSDFYVSTIVDETNKVSDLILQARDLEASGNLPEAFRFLGESLLTVQNIIDFGEYRSIKNELLRLGSDAVTYRPSDLYKAVGAIDYRDPIIARVSGFVTEIQQDFLAGTRIVVSDTTRFDTFSLVIVQPSDVQLDVKIGDEVLFLTVPEFINVATPLEARGWIQP